MFPASVKKWSTAAFVLNLAFVSSSFFTITFLPFPNVIGKIALDMSNPSSLIAASVVAAIKSSIVFKFFNSSAGGFATTKTVTSPDFAPTQSVESISSEAKVLSL